RVLFRSLVTAQQGTMTPSTLTVGIMATPTPVFGGTDYASKPVVKLYDNTGTEMATVNAGDVTLNGDGSVSIDLSTLPAAVTTAGSYTAKADDGPVYLDPAGTTVASVGSGYAAVPSLDVVAPDGSLNPGDVTAALTLVGDKLTVTASGTPTQTGIYKVQISDGPLASNLPAVTAGSGYDPSETPVTTISDSVGAAAGTTTVTNNGDGTLTIDLSTLPGGLTTAGNYTAKSADGTVAATPSPVNVGSGYSVSEPVPSVSITGGPVGTLSVASSTINPDGTVGISFAGNPSGGGPVSISVGSGGTVSQVDGLTNEDLDLWDFSMSDFIRYIQVLANVRSVNGAESSSFNFSETLITNNFENLEMASSRIMDTDMASEMVKVAKYRIKTSSAADMLAKHNKLSTMVDLTVMNLI
ncbi:MAG: flagellin, partial [Pirellulaceae bacterium]